MNSSVSLHTGVSLFTGLLEWTTGLTKTTIKSLFQCSTEAHIACLLC